MAYFSLPEQTVVSQVIPKKSFDKYSNTKQKKAFTTYVQRITWLHKLSQDTINLHGKDVTEIQVFRVELKEKEYISGLLEIIDKAIPYHIIFIAQSEGEMYLSVSAKHPHPVNPATSVLDWTFRTDWFSPADKSYVLNLAKSLDAVFEDFCYQISGHPKRDGLSFEELIARQQRKQQLRREITSLAGAIRREKQFNRKVALNLKLQKAEQELAEMG